MSVAAPATVGEPTRRKRRRPRLSDGAAAHGRERITPGQLTAGEFIRRETVAQELDISATPARKGLLALQSEGLLKVEPRRGFWFRRCLPKTFGTPSRRRRCWPGSSQPGLLSSPPRRMSGLWRTMLVRRHAMTLEIPVGRPWKTGGTDHHSKGPPA